MVSLGIGTAAAAPKGEAEATFRAGWVKHFRVGLSSAGGAAIILAIFELLQRQPIEGFKLLGTWGPWPVVALVGLAYVGHFMKRLADSMQTTFSAVVESSQVQARASGRTADALTRLAEQGGRQAEEVQRLAIYAAQEFPGVYERFDRQDTVLQGLTDAVKDLGTRGTLANPLRDAVRDLREREKND